MTGLVSKRVRALVCVWEAGYGRRRRGYVEYGVDPLENLKSFFGDVDSRNAIIVAAWIPENCMSIDSFYFVAFSIFFYHWSRTNQSR